MKKSGIPRRAGGRMRGKPALAAIAVAAITACCAACGSSGGGAGSAPSSQPSSGSATPAGVASAQALVTKAEQVPSAFAPPGPAFGAAKAKGKSLFYIDYSSSPVVDEWASVAAAQLGKYGVKVHHVNGQGSTASFDQALKEAVAQHAGAIMLMGIDPASVAQQVAAAKSAGIPVLVGSNEQLGIPDSPGVVAAATIDGVAVGKLLADWMIASSGGKAHVAIITHEGVLGTAQEVGGIQNELTRLCSSCTSKVVNLPFTQINTEEQLALSLMQQDQQTNFIVPVYDFELASIAPAVTAAHAQDRVKLASFNALPNVLQLMAKSGSSVQADVGSPNAWFGYSIADQVLRVLTGTAPVASENNPLRLFVPSNIASLDLSSEAPAWYGSVDYAAGYLKLWGPPAK